MKDRSITTLLREYKSFIGAKILDCVELEYTFRLWLRALKKAGATRLELARAYDAGYYYNQEYLFDRKREEENETY